MDERNRCFCILMLPWWCPTRRGFSVVSVATWRKCTILPCRPPSITHWWRQTADLEGEKDTQTELKLNSMLSEPWLLFRGYNLSWTKRQKCCISFSHDQTYFEATQLQQWSSATFKTITAIIKCCNLIQFLWWTGQLLFLDICFSMTFWLLTHATIESGV